MSRTKDDQIQSQVLLDSLQQNRTQIFLFSFFLSLHYYSNLKVNKSIYVCKAYHWNSDNHELFQYLMETLMGFLIPFTFIVFCYTSVICRLRSAMFHGRIKGSFLILIIISAFALFWLPYHVINILQVLCIGEHPSNQC